MKLLWYQITRGWRILLQNRFVSDRYKLYTFPSQTCYPHGQVVLLSHKSDLSPPTQNSKALYCLWDVLWSFSVHVNLSISMKWVLLCNQLSHLPLWPENLWSNYIQVPVDLYDLHEACHLGTRADWFQEVSPTGIKQQQHQQQQQNVLIEVIRLVYVIFE